MNKEFDFLIYNSENTEERIQVILKEDTIWLTQKAMGELFGVTAQNITIHLKEIYETKELEFESTCKEFLQVQNEGKREVKRKRKFYNLDAIISVGYRVNSSKATKFRIWATKVLKEYMIKGFAMDDNRLKQGSEAFGKDYFRELLDRIRSIRASERRIWQQITDIFAECSIDYDKNSKYTKEFYATVQNRFHYAITGYTAAEIIYNSADREKENMGLNVWKNSPDGRILKSDVIVAKNYLKENEIKQLERTISGYFDYIEDLVERGNTFTMEEFSKSINEFLEFRRYDVLKDKGSISQKMAQQKAISEYEEFNKTQKIISDFDKFIEKLKKENR